jgi:hypothetical protein
MRELQLAAFRLRIQAVTRPVRRSLQAGVALLMGCCLLGLAVPRTVAAWEAIAAQPAIQKLEIGARPSTESVDAGVAALNRSLQWVSSGRRLTDLALLELELARWMVPEEPMRATWLQRSETHLVEGLEANPADGWAWLRLAVVRDLQRGNPRSVAAPLIRSVDVAPNTRPLWLPRAEYLLAYWPAFESDELTVMRSQLRTIWHADEASRQPLLEMAARSKQLTILGWSLAQDLAAYREFEAMKLKSGL